MAKKSDGEVEVMLSDRQLILLFLVGVVLLAAFFGMGFMVGKRWAAPAPAATAAAGRPAEALTKMAENLQKPKPASELAPAESAQAGVPEASGKRDVSSPATPAAQAETETYKVIEPRRGTVYLQVGAPDWRNAKILLDSLREKGFPSVIAPGPAADVFRVLVGPFEGAEEMASMRLKLKAAGFDPIVRKY